MIRYTYLIPFLLTFALLSCAKNDKKDGIENTDRVVLLNERVLRGWNTWNNPSVLSHVYMPDGLNLQLMYRKKRGGPYWLDEAYIASPKYNFPERILPLEHALDGSYTALELEWEGARAKVESATDGEDILIQYTPLGKI
ncbi:MAG: hypothetical protein AAGA86_15835 [Bacteroidota bacterium]